MATVLSYDFAEANGSSTTADGAGGTFETGTFYGDATTDGSSNAVFDGSGDYLEAAPSAALGLSQGAIIINFTLDPATTGQNTLLSIDSNFFDGGGHVQISVQSDRTIEIRHQDTSTSHYLNAPAITAGTPVKLAYSFGPSGGKLYINDVETDSTTTPLVMAGDVEPLVLGASQHSSGDGVADNLQNFFQGSLHNVMIDNDPGAADPPPVCFCAKTRVATPKGWQAIGDLQAGDKILTHSNGAATIRHVHRTVYRRGNLETRSNLHPIVIEPGALGNDTRLRLSRQHCIAMRTPSGEIVLVRALHLALARHPRVRQAKSTKRIDYVHLELARHDLVLAEEVWCETLWPGNTRAKLTRSKPPPHCFRVLLWKEARRLISDGKLVPLAAVHAEHAE